MRSIVTVLSAAVLVAGCAHQGGLGAGARSEAADEETALAELLSDRTAGPPQDCVSEPSLAGNQSFGRGAIVFTGRTGDVLYINKVVGGCPGLGRGRAITTRTTTTRLCSGDIVTVFDPATGIEFGSCTLGEFTPYRKAP
jgi:hypothetical protein